MKDDPQASRAALGFALMVPALLLAQQSGSMRPREPTELLGIYGVGLAVSVFLGSRLGRGRPHLSGLVALGIHLAGLVLVLGSFLLLVSKRPSIGRMITLGFLGLAAPRLWWGIDGRARYVLLGLGLMALLGLARTEAWVFGVCTASYLGAAVICLMTADVRAWPAILRYPRDLLLPLLVAFGLATAVLVGLGWALPVAEPIVAKALSPYLAGESAVSGFGDGTVELGHVGRIVTSDTVVMRVHGELDHLRGQVYVGYRFGRWQKQVASQLAPRAGVDGAIVLDPRPPQREVRLEAEPEAGPALFAPLEARRLVRGPPGTSLGEFGVLRLSHEQISEPRVWTLGVADGAPAHVAPPSKRDLELPTDRSDRAEWEAAAARHGLSAMAPAERAEAVRRVFLDGFVYSLSLDEVPYRVDPVLHFFQTARRGHCEYFASAYVLLARAAGLPARMVTGYRVFERNPAGGWYIVRQRDAHAWAEVFVDGAWRTVDPTPPGVLAGEQRPEAGWFAARWDAFKRWLRQAVERLGALTALEFMAILAAVLALVGLLVFIRRRADGAAPPPPRHTFGPLEQLELHLGRRSPRPPHQTLAQWAATLRIEGQPAAADLVDACARWLYGGRGDPAAIAAAVERWAAR